MKVTAGSWQQGISGSLYRTAQQEREKEASQMRKPEYILYLSNAVSSGFSEHHILCSSWFYC